MEKYRLVQKDTRPILKATLCNEDGTPIALSGHTVRFRLAAYGAGSATLTKTATIVDPTNGRVEVQFSGTDLNLTVGLYEGVFEIDLSGAGTDYLTSARLYFELEDTLRP